jgi:hypothetical protein
MQTLAVIFFAISGILVTMIAFSLLAKLTGVGQTINNILSFFGSFFTSIFHTLNTIVQAAPPFIKIIFFVILFGIFGTVIYSFTMGLTHACVEGDLYSMDYMTAVGSIFVPKVVEREFESFYDLPKSYQDGIVLTGSEGQPKIIVPHLYAPHVYSALNPDALETGVSDYKWFIDGGDLSFWICKTEEDICYLNDKTDIASLWSSESNYRFLDSNCAIRDDSGVLLADGSVIYEIHIMYDEKQYIDGRNDGLVYVVDRISNAISLSKCQLDSGSLFELGSQIVDLSKPDTKNNTYGVGTVYNAMAVSIQKTQRGSEETFLNEPVLAASASAEDDPNVNYIKSKAVNFNSYVKKYGVVSNETESSQLMSYVCEDKITNDESFRFFGIPIFDMKFIGLVAFVTLALFAVGFVKGK